VAHVRRQPEEKSGKEQAGEEKAGDEEEGNAGAGGILIESKIGRGQAS
jgi:hypothetical protein